MRLLLTVLGLQRSTLGDRSTHIFGEAGGTLGRSASCDWILPDERNTLSARHARISHNGRGFLITDTSTNGVYLNAVDVPLGRDQSAPLSNGDTIYLADYIISVAILREEPAPAPMPVSMPVAAAPLVPAAPPPVAPPQPIPAAAPAIPMGLELSAPAPVMPSAVPAAATRQPTQLPGLIPDDFDFSDLAPARPHAAPTPVAAMPVPAVPPPAPVTAMPPVAAVDPLALLRQRAMARAASIDLTPQEPGAPSRPMADVALPRGSSVSSSGDAAAFWSGIGIDPARIPPEARARLLEELGGALRQAAGGLVSMLSARKSMKDEFRLDQTRLAPQENNPFKFFSHGDEALRRVVVEGAPGFLPLDMAVKQCFADMHAHEVALASAMQTSIRELLDRLAPARLESEAEPGLLGRKPDRSRLWERYAELHSELAGDLDRTIRMLVSDELARASARGPGAKA
ncbi:MAG: type VI secretion system-associated FHA domain protein TagH [Bosea sp.]|uniref:type VI secretion system-associated FHA domain protein TagH n=1 Tax=Bosea sp. (in: a-proteobacteria) TaxID=1871050 RepID=UPI002393444A|nr:type VI secretion system-associated FHA domain protein TagH [Bosea sp. (in: a-proteobacteria)]MCP4737577.1 type VI secretion system-associated FHA domain protein TagH [Bosea sp. (in: a-proteobacteria)]